ncbi:MAG: anti-sigma factor RsbA family regulatory protein [Actinomycetes bacterium]
MTPELLSPPTGSGLVHQALLYRTGREFADAVVPYVRDGLAQRDRVVVITSPGNVELLRRELMPEEQEAVELRCADASYIRPGPALAGYHELLAGHARSGQRLRVVGEQPLAALPDKHVRELCRVDAAFNDVCSFPGVSIVCPYDVGALAPDVIDLVRRSHPELTSGGRRRRNPDYVTPAELLAEHRHGPPLDEPNGPLRELIRPTRPSEARAFVADSARQLGVDGPRLDDFLIAVNEITANAFRHATIDRVRVWREADRLCCGVRDSGPGLADPLAGYRQPALDASAGRGMWLAHQLADLVEVRTGPTGTVVRLHLLTHSTTVAVPDQRRASPIAAPAPTDSLHTGWVTKQPEHLRSAVLTSREPVVVEGRDGRLLLASPAAQELFALPGPDVDGTPSARLWHDATSDAGAPLSATPAARAIQSGDVVSGVLLTMETSGGPRVLTVTAVPVSRPGEHRPYAAMTLFAVAANASTSAPAAGSRRQLRRAAFAQQLTSALERRDGGSVSLASITIGDLTPIDRKYGSRVTDAVLAIVTRRLRRALSSQCRLTRLDSRHYAVLAVNVSQVQLEALRQSLSSVVQRPVHLAEIPTPLHVDALVRTHTAHPGDDAAGILRALAETPPAAPTQPVE